MRPKDLCIVLLPLFILNTGPAFVVGHKKLHNFSAPSPKGTTVHSRFKNYGRKSVSSQYQKRRSG